MCSGPGPMKIAEITHKGDKWEVTLQGAWQEKITLNEKPEQSASSHRPTHDNGVRDVWCGLWR